MNMPTHKRAVNGLLSGLLGSLLCLSGTAAAQLVESEGNDTQGDATLLCIPNSGVSVTAGIGAGGASTDMDIFAFDAASGEAPAIQVTTDGTWDPLMVLYDDLGNILNQSDDTYVPAYSTDPSISNYALPASGRYFVAVAASPNYLGANFAPFAPGTAAMGGTYTLDISNFTASTVSAASTGGTASSGTCSPVAEEEELPPPVEEPPVTDEGATIITMEVLHWRGQDRQISKHWKKRMKRVKRRMVRRYGVYPIPVVMYSSDTFDATAVDPKSLSFGTTGDEDSLFRCSRHGRDINKDGMKDMLCFFDAFKTGLDAGKVQGHLKGETHHGEEFTSSASLKVYKLVKNKRNGKEWDRRSKRYDRWKSRNQSRWNRHHD
jgi:hypothetical protein